MAELQDIAGGLLILVGAFFYLVGAIGIYRMPDVYTRMHAASVSETLGVGLLILGMMVLAGFTLVTAKLAIILGIILFTSPIATHAVAQAALHEGIKPAGVGNDILIGPDADDRPEKIGKKVVRRQKTPARKARSTTSKRKTAKRSAAHRTSTRRSGRAKS